MDAAPPRNSREQLQAWLRYFTDLNLGDFYTDRMPSAGEMMVKMPKLHDASRVSDSRSGEPPQPATAALSVANAKPDATQLLPVIPSPSVTGLKLVPELRAGAGSDGRVTLEDLRENLGECTRCRLHQQRTKIVFGAGNPQARLVFVGEAPGRDEDLQGLPFVGRAGKLLTQMIEAMGLTRDAVYICNVVKCRPPENRRPEDDEIATCSPYLSWQIDLIAPTAIVCLGAVAAQTLLQTTDPISRFRGNWFDFRGSKLIPTYHPAYLLRNPAAKGEVWKDLQKVMVLLGLPLPKSARS